MKGNTIGEFIDDILLTGGPEKEFVFRTRYYFLETRLNLKDGWQELHIDEYDNSDSKRKVYLCSHVFKGHNFTECVNEFEDTPIFEGMTIYQAEQEIEVLFG